MNTINCDAFHHYSPFVQVQSSTPKTVLFVCVHNAGRSQMAAGFLRHIASDDIRVLSGGSNPGASINPIAAQAMAEVGIDITQQLPRPFDDASVQQADVVITMGCGDSCPVFPGKRYEDWALDDPAGQPIETVRRIRDDIEKRVTALFHSLVDA